MRREDGRRVAAAQVPGVQGAQAVRVEDQRQPDLIQHRRHQRRDPGTPAQPRPKGHRILALGQGQEFPRRAIGQPAVFILGQAVYLGRHTKTEEAGD